MSATPPHSLVLYVIVNPPHICRRLNTRHKLKRDIREADKGYQPACGPFHPVVTHDDAADEEVEGAATDEGEHEAGISCDLRRDLEFCERSERVDCKGG